MCRKDYYLEVEGGNGVVLYGYSKREARRLGALTKKEHDEKYGSGSSNDGGNGTYLWG